ncbi:MAG: Fe(2+) transporter permease subunit FeoB [Deltaproteobacteria bacterium]|nr:Fe(2+) transporter permease subunit FeoB [Deltaproteobacteria bacterium]
MDKHIIGIVGNPNCGKTTLFNAMTGARQRVGNWPGVTVDKKSGEYTYEKEIIEVVDLPGIYSLSAASLDEKVARDYILSKEAGVIVNIVDASNLERNLYLTVQLLEMKTPLIVVLNMMDMAEKNHMEIDIKALSKRLGCEVIPMVASKGKGIEQLKLEISRALKKRQVPATLKTIYADPVRTALDDLVSVIGGKISGRGMDPEWAAIKMLEGDAEITALVADKEARKRLDHHLKKIQAETEEEADILVAEARYEMIGRVVAESVKKKSRIGKSASDRIDNIVLNRALGIPIFLIAMYLVFMVTINVGGAFIDFFDIFAATIFVDGFSVLLTAMHSPEWLTALLAGGIGGGIQTIATFIPPIGFMFLCLSILEDSGYMARAAFVMDRLMRFVGLPGKSFVPMLVGFGCNVPAIMATRTLENERDRTLTVMMNPFMSCGARLPVYALFAAAFFPAGGQNLVFGLYLLGICFAVLTGIILKNTLLKGEVSPFIMELPPYHRPSLGGVFMRAWDRLKTFIFRAGKVIIPIVIILSFFNSMGTDGTFGNEDSDKSILSSVGRSITPVFEPIGIQEDNWPATVGIFTGIFAKEAVVGTLDSLYAQIGEAQAEEVEGGSEAEEEEGFDFWGGIVESFATIPANLAGVADTVTDPMGLSLGDVSSVETAAEGQEVSLGTFGAMVSLFDGRIGAFSYLLFILLYFPCVAAIAAVYRETNLKWAAFSGAWTTGLAYIAATVFYQAATFSRHALSSSLWLAGMCLVFMGAVLVMRYIGANARDRIMSTSGALATGI